MKLPIILVVLSGFALTGCGEEKEKEKEKEINTEQIKMVEVKAPKPPALITIYIEASEGNYCRDLNPESGIDDDKFGDLLLAARKTCQDEIPRKYRRDMLAASLTAKQSLIVDGFDFLFKDSLSTERSCEDYGAMINYACPHFIR